MRRWANAVTAALLAVAFVTVTAHGLSIRGPSALCQHGSAHTRHECRASLLPSRYPVSQMGDPDTGGGMDHHGPAGRRSITTLTAPDRPADRVFHLTAAHRHVVVNGQRRMAYTLNGRTPGPVLHVTQGDLVKVVLRNRNIGEGTSLHWHGVDLSGRNDGVAGVTQNAVRPGGKYVYRFIVPDAGTYWYHSHQHAQRQVAEGLFGALIAVAPDAPAQPGPDVVAAVHSYGSTPTINGSTDSRNVTATPGATARVRFINTNNAPVRVAATAPFRVVAIDGFDVQQPGSLADTFVELPAGGRADLSFETGQEALRVGVIGGPSVVIGPVGGAEPGPVAGTAQFDPLVYGRTSQPVDLGAVDRDFRYVVGQRFGFLNGRAGNWYTINGRSLPHVPMYVVHTGDVVRLRFVNKTAVPHPMHLHGHHFRVVSRDGRPSVGAPWWADSLKVNPGQEFVVEFVADNPGVWMFHCHNLPHVTQGLMTHLMYDGVRTPFRIGRVGPGLRNDPE